MYKRPGFEIEAGHGGAIAMLLIPDDMSQEITEWGNSKINDDEVYGKDGKGRDGSPHITLQNGIIAEDADELEKLFSELSGMEAELGPIDIFSNDDKDYDVVHITIMCDDLHAVNAMTSDLLEINNPHEHDFIPHITLAYVKKGAGKRFKGLEDFKGKKVNLSRLVIDGPGIEPRTIDLKGREDKIDGGIADSMNYGDFDKDDLKEGADHELEHTKNIEIATEIAMDHLAEDPDYYRNLKKIESRKPLKDSLDYGYRTAAYDAEDLESYLLDSGRSVKDLKPGEAASIIRNLRKVL